MNPDDLEQNAAKHVVDFFAKSVGTALDELLVMRNEYYDLHYQASSPAELVHNPSFKLILKRLKAQVENLRHLQSLVVMTKSCMQEHATEVECQTFLTHQNRLIRCITTIQQLSHHIVRATGIMI